MAGRPSVIPHQVLLMLLNYRKTRIRESIVYDLISDDGDSEGWLIKEEIQGKYCPFGRKKENESKNKKYKEAKSSYYLNRKEIAEFIESRHKFSNKGELSCKILYSEDYKTIKSNKTYGFEKQESELKKRWESKSVSAYRIKRDKSTWKGLYKYFKDRESLREFYRTNYFNEGLIDSKSPFFKIYADFFEWLVGEKIKDPYTMGVNEDAPLMPDGFYVSQYLPAAFELFLFSTPSVKDKARNSLKIILQSEFFEGIGEFRQYLLSTVQRHFILNSIINKEGGISEAAQNKGDSPTSPEASEGI